MGKVLLSVLGVVGLVTIGPGCCFAPGASGGSSGTGASATPTATPRAATPATPVTACEVDDAYHANEIAAAQQYPEGAHVIVSGTVDRISQTFGTMAITPRRCMLAHVRLEDSEAAAAAALHPGDPFSADCTIGHFIMGAVFDDCRLVAAAP